jgi:acetolactate synthase I/II/III large subunit
LAAQERPGPVFLELPEDIMKERCEGKPLPIPPSATLGLDRPAIGKVRDLLAAAQRPLVLAGHGVVRAHAAVPMMRFAEAWNIPVAMTWQGAGALPFDHPLSLGTVGLRRADSARSAFESSDMIILIGFDLMEFEAQFWNVGASKWIVYIGSVPCSSSPGLRPVQVLGDISSTLKALSDGASAKASWTSDLKAQLVTSLNTVPDEVKGIKPQAIVRAIRDSLGRDDIAVSDVGAHLIWMAQRYPVYKENTLLMSNGLIPMGVGVPWAIAAKMTFPERKVVASVGDGSFLMTGMELLTAKELGTPIIVVVWNDSEYRLIRAKQEAGFKRTNGVKFLNPDFEDLAKSMGFKGHKVGTATELRGALTEAVKDDEYVLIEVMVDSEEPLRFG